MNAHSHQIYLGDASRILLRLKPESIDLVCTGPPYWKTVAYSQDQGQIGKIEEYHAYIHAMKQVWQGIAHVLKPGAILCFWVHDLYDKERYIPLHSDLVRILPSCITPKRIVVWDRYLTRAHAVNSPKPVHTLLQYIVIAQKSPPAGNSDFISAFNTLYWKPVWHKKTLPRILGSALLYRLAYSARSNLFRANAPSFRKTALTSLISNPYKEMNYATRCPHEVAKRCIELFSKPNDTILDPFLGTGTTLIEAHKLQRQCTGIEIALSAVPVLRERLHVFPVSYISLPFYL